MFTSRQSDLRRDVVLFVERSSELLYMARLNSEGMEPKRKRVLIARFKSYVIDPKLSDLSMVRMKPE